MKLMTQEEYIEYLKKKAKALEMDYIEMLERRAYLKYQVQHIKDVMFKEDHLA